MENTENVQQSPELTPEMKKASFTLNGLPFNPYEHFSMISSKGGGQKQYLGVQWRIAWFRAVHPKGVIKKHIIEHDREAGYIFVKVEVVTPEGLYAEDYAEGTRASFPGGYVEKTLTKATGRALAELGFGTQFAQELEEDTDDLSKLADTPQPARRPVATNGATKQPTPVNPTKPATNNVTTHKTEPTPENKKPDTIPNGSALMARAAAMELVTSVGNPINWTALLRYALKADIEAGTYKLSDLLAAKNNLPPKVCQKIETWLDAYEAAKKKAA